MQGGIETKSILILGMSIIINSKHETDFKKTEDVHINPLLSDNIIGYIPSEILQVITKY